MFLLTMCGITEKLSGSELPSLVRDENASNKQDTFDSP
jgi:hypothetical protein